MTNQHQDLLQKQLAAIEEASVEGILTVNVRGTILSASEQACRLFRAEWEQLRTHPLQSLLRSSIPVVDPDKEHGQSLLDNLAARSSAEQLTALRCDGTEFPIRLSVRSYSDVLSAYYTCVIHDLSSVARSRDRILQLHAKLREHNSQLEAAVEQRTAQLSQSISDLAEANKQLALEIKEREAIARSLQKREMQLERLLRRERELGELRSRFVSMASHEFRTPLTTMLSSVEIIEMSDDSASPMLLKHTRRIREGIGYLRNVLEDFLQLGKLDVKGTDLHIQELDVVELVETLVADLELMCKPGQDIELNVAGDFAPTPHSANGIRIILTNLVGNAIKYSDDGAAIDVDLERQDDRILLKVSDEGMGIPEAEQPYLFERFYRASNAETIKGTGLGLHILATYARAMKGTINVDSQAGEGSTFTVNLPYVLPVPGQTEEPST